MALKKKLKLPQHWLSKSSQSNIKMKTRSDVNYSSSPTLPKLKIPMSSANCSPNSTRNISLRFALLEPLPPIRIKCKNKDKFNESPIKAMSSDSDNSREIGRFIDEI